MNTLMNRWIAITTVWTLSATLFKIEFSKLRKNWTLIRRFQKLTDYLEGR